MREDITYVTFRSFPYPPIYFRGLANQDSSAYTFHIYSLKTHFASMASLSPWILNHKQHS